MIQKLNLFYGMLYMKKIFKMLISISYIFLTYFNNYSIENK